MNSELHGGSPSAIRLARIPWTAADRTNSGAANRTNYATRRGDVASRMAAAVAGAGSIDSTENRPITPQVSD
jgi:hypothetical protein